MIEVTVTKEYALLYLPIKISQFLLLHIKFSRAISDCSIVGTWVKKFHQQSSNHIFILIHFNTPSNTNYAHALSLTERKQSDQEWISVAYGVFHVSTNVNISRYAGDIGPLMSAPSQIHSKTQVQLCIYLPLYGADGIGDSQRVAKQIMAISNCNCRVKGGYEQHMDMVQYLLSTHPCK